MSEEEALRTVENGGLVPSINKKTGQINRKARWISEKGSELTDTNKYNTHKVEITTKKGALDWLKEHSVDWDDVFGGEKSVTDRVITKEVEPGSYGIGHELLEEFNQFITNIKVTKIK